MKNKFLKKITLIGTGATTFLATSVQTVFADPNGALSQAKTSLDSQIKPIVNTVIVPIIASILLIILLVAISKAVASYRRGGDVELFWIVLLIIGIILITTFPTWGWAMIG